MIPAEVFLRSSSDTQVCDAVKFNMADWVHRLSLTASETIDSITKMRFFAVFAVALFLNLSNQVYGKEKLAAKILSIYLHELDEKSQTYPSIKVRVILSLG